MYGRDLIYVAAVAGDDGLSVTEGIKTADFDDYNTVQTAPVCF
jgi:hypothetical protein